MGDWLKKGLVLGIIALCADLLFLGGKQAEASLLPSYGTNDEWIWPADGVISDTYGTRKGKHKGIDIAGKLNTPVYAVAHGFVEKSYFSNTYGNVVFIQHQNHYVTVYAHLSVRKVTEGQFVKQGDLIGKMGRTGQATGVHLHFETHKAEWTYDKKFALDPETLLGRKKVGEVVLAGVVHNEENAMEASLGYSAGEESWKDRPAVKRNQANPQKVIYIVKKGDTLSTISSKRNVAVEKIRRLNHLATDVIKPQQILILN